MRFRRPILERNLEGFECWVIVEARDRVHVGSYKVAKIAGFFIASGAIQYSGGIKSYVEGS